MAATPIDWSEIQRVDTDLPSRLNRAFRSLGAGARDVDGRLDDLESAPAAALSDIEAEIDALQAEDVALEAEIDALQAEDVALDARLDALEVSSDLTGSIFSATGPLSGAAPVALYDFTEVDYAGSLSDATIVGSDVSTVGSPIIPGPFPFHAPSAAGKLGGSVRSFAQNSHVRIATRPAALALTGAMTAEWLGRFPRRTGTPPGTADALANVYLVNVGAVSVGSGTNNWLYSLFWRNANLKWSWYQESGTGPTSMSADFGAALVLEELENMGTIMVTGTRATNGRTVTLYVNGRQIAASQTLAAAPDHGSGSPFTIGQCPGNASDAFADTYAVRVSDYEFTADQVAESYSRTFYGRAA